MRRSRLSHGAGAGALIRFLLVSLNWFFFSLFSSLLYKNVELNVKENCYKEIMELLVQMLDTVSQNAVRQPQNKRIKALLHRPLCVEIKHWFTLACSDCCLFFSPSTAFSLWPAVIGVSWPYLPIKSLDPLRLMWPASFRWEIICVCSEVRCTKDTRRCGADSRQ